MPTAADRIKPRRIAGAPACYDQLRAFLPDRRQRQLALGVTENTIMAWDSRRVKRVRVEHQRKVNLLFSTCTKLSEFFASNDEVGRFLTTPQLILDNREPFGLIRLHGERGAKALVAIVADERRRGAQLREKLELEPVLNDDEAWDVIRKGLSDTAIERLDASAAATRKLREKRGSTDVLN
jgi:hypothetical protein